MHAYIKTDQLLHRLSQLIAKMNRQFVAKKEDDSHTNFYFDPLQGALVRYQYGAYNISFKFIGLVF